jgi:hypothetical protein
LIYLLYLNLFIFFLILFRLSESSPQPKVASAAAKAYFVDLNDMTEWAIKKDGKTICAAYEKSLVDLAAFRAAL